MKTGVLKMSHLKLSQIAERQGKNSVCTQEIWGNREKEIWKFGLLRDLRCQEGHIFIPICQCWPTNNLKCLGKGFVVEEQFILLGRTWAL